ncbi:uncharacterized protein PRCAT00001120001 [Priceomyces carsonii]|uniref:uncharacterized protein n=1 Tax=Priceomyces carsonii TaxID=28549 RepID=UPI002EDA663B|nr:unnamed protein product [Priceomyces carsonii]
MNSSDSILCSRFDGSKSFLAYGSISLDIHEVRVVSISSSQSSLDALLKLDKSSKLTNLNWIRYEDNDLLAVCLTKGSIILYSPLSNEIISELFSSEQTSMLDFHYSELTKTGWSCDIGGNIYEWDMLSFKLMQKFKVVDLQDSASYFERLTVIKYRDAPHLLGGSFSLQLINLDTKERVKSFPGHIEPINTLVPVPSDPDLFLTSAKNDRFINMYSIEKNATKSIYTSQACVQSYALGSKDGRSILVAIDEEGSMEIFNNPLESKVSESAKTGVKKKRKQMVDVQSRIPECNIRLTRPADQIKNPSDSNLRIISVSIKDDSILFSWMEGPDMPYFDSMTWIDHYGHCSLTEDIIMEKKRPNTKITKNSLYGHDISATKHYNEGNAIITEGGSLRDIDDDDQDETLAEKLEKLNAGQKSQSLKRQKKKGGSIITSLAVVLSQSLKNDDNTLLESVLSNRDSQVICETITRLDPSLVVILLDRLSEKIIRQSSKFDQLNYWLKWIIIIHGGYLATVPRLSSQLVNLHAILNKKATTLPRLLELQGRLGMLYKQKELEHEILSPRFESLGDEFDSDVEYIEEMEDEQLFENDNTSGHSSIEIEDRFNSLDDGEEASDNL